MADFHRAGAPAHKRVVIEKRKETNYSAKRYAASRSRHLCFVGQDVSCFVGLGSLWILMVLLTRTAPEADSRDGDVSEKGFGEWFPRAFRACTPRFCWVVRKTICTVGRSALRCVCRSRGHLPYGSRGSRGPMGHVHPADHVGSFRFLPHRVVPGRETLHRFCLARGAKSKGWCSTAVL
jgi:hypothetical protein